ncbi:hypothetical protein E8E14_006776 [Neopestalotiopsis sp. 37M]|nr:hypothetical protein E8E14_006776 [Neopestalotiopsis sp. 37M]
MPKEDAPSKGQKEPPSDAANTFSHDRTLPERLRQYDQSRQLTSQSLGPLKTPQGEGKPPIASFRGLRSDHDARSEDFDSFISESSEPMEESLVGTQNLQTGDYEHDTLQHDPNSIPQDFLENHHRPSSDRQALVDGTSFSHPPPISRHSRHRAPVVMLARQRNPARTSHRRASTTTATSSSTDQSSVFSSQYVDSEFSASTAPSLGSDPNGMGFAFLPCEFVGYTYCDERYDLVDTEKWMNHIINDHLRYQLPTKCACWFCDDWVFDTEVNRLDDLTNFRQRLYHIRDHIAYSGYGIPDIRPDYNFLSHLWSLGMITQKTYDETLRHREGPPPNVTGIYRYDFVPPERQHDPNRDTSLVVSESSREERRRGRRDGRKHDHGYQNRLYFASGTLEEQSLASPPNHLSPTRTKDNELSESHQTIQRTPESYPSSPSTYFSAVEISKMLDDADTSHDANTLTDQVVLAESLQSKLEGPRDLPLSPSSTYELPENHEKPSTSSPHIQPFQTFESGDVTTLESSTSYQEATTFRSTSTTSLVGLVRDGIERLSIFDHCMENTDTGDNIDEKANVTEEEHGEDVTEVESSYTDNQGPGESSSTSPKESRSSLKRPSRDTRNRVREEESDGDRDQNERRIGPDQKRKKTLCTEQPKRFSCPYQAYDATQDCCKDRSITCVRFLEHKTVLLKERSCLSA